MSAFIDPLEDSSAAERSPDLPSPFPTSGSTGKSGRKALLLFWHRDPAGFIWSILFILILLAITIGPQFVQSPSAIDPSKRLLGPSSEHWLGTDNFGRDILSRIINAGRISLAIGAAVTVVSCVVGSMIGLLSGFYNRVDGPTMRLVDAMLAFPPLILAIALVAFFGQGAKSEIIALCIVLTPYIARVVRSSTLALRDREYVAAARSSGLGGVSILRRHILPNAFPTILVQASFVFAFVLLSDAALSFLGLGVASPTPTWGNMVADARPYITSSPGFIVFPGLAIVIVVMALNIIGDSVRDLVDPRSRSLVDLQRLRSMQGKD